MPARPLRFRDEEHDAFVARSSPACHPEERGGEAPETEIGDASTGYARASRLGESGPPKTAIFRRALE